MAILLKDLLWKNVEEYHWYSCSVVSGCPGLRRRSRSWHVKVPWPQIRRPCGGWRSTQVNKSSKSVDTKTQNWKITRSTITTTQWIFIPFSKFSVIVVSSHLKMTLCLFIFQNGSKWETKYKSAPFQEHLKVLKNKTLSQIWSVPSWKRCELGFRQPWKTNLLCWHLSAECCKVVTKCFEEQFYQRAFRYVDEKFKSLLWNFSWGILKRRLSHYGNCSHCLFFRMITPNKM